MKSIFIKDKNFTPLPEPVCAAIGNFDGVHLGHQKLIDECKRHGYKSAVLTFYPHPSVFLKKIPNYPLITPLEKKTDIISRLGVDYLIVVEFDDEISQMPKDEFIQIMKYMNIKSCVCGYDFTFGRRAEGNISDLIKEFEFYEVKKFIFDDVRVSSTYIRELLSDGNVHEANRLLGRTFSITGKVKYGNQKGRFLGFPTANIQLDDTDKLLPADGVYAVQVEVEDRCYGGMLSIGKRPTIDNGSDRSIEVYILHFDGDLYGQPMTVHLLEHTRDEVKFSSKEELAVQLQKDKEQIEKLLKDSDK